MRRTKILNADEVRRKLFSEAKNEFVKHCRIKNMRPTVHSLISCIKGSSDRLFENMGMDRR